MIDTNALFRGLLLNDQAVATLVAQDPATGAEVYCPDLPEGFDPRPPADNSRPGRRCIVLATRGGFAHPEMPVVRPSVRVTCWALRPTDARELYRAVWDAVHGATAVDLGDLGFVMSCLEQTHGQDVTDPDTGWAMVISFFELTARAA